MFSLARTCDFYAHPVQVNDMELALNENAELLVSLVH